ncbi:MAG: DUF3662 and FHA domain-containing protein [Ilumatobacteraceae bacterium]
MGSAASDSLGRTVGLQSLERRLERIVEGVFTRRSSSSVRPIELGRRVVREMDDQRNVDVKGRRIVPNAFDIRLNPRDHQAMIEIGEILRTELAEAAREYAREEGYHFLGPVAVDLHPDEGQKPGRFVVDSHLRQGDSGIGVGTLVMPSGDRVDIGGTPLVVGRLPECAITLSDHNVSRRHAEVAATPNGFVVARPRLHQRHDGQRRPRQRRPPPPRRRHRELRLHLRPLRELLTRRRTGHRRLASTTPCRTRSSTS